MVAALYEDENFTKRAIRKQQLGSTHNITAFEQLTLCKQQKTLSFQSWVFMKKLYCLGATSKCFSISEIFTHAMVLAKKEHIYFGSHDNFYCLIFAMYLRTTLLCSGVHRVNKLHQNYVTANGCQQFRKRSKIRQTRYV